MIVTVTPNPSLDRTLVVNTFERGGVNRAAEVRVDPGGKGVNVARAVTAAKHSALALMPLGGAQGAKVRALLAAEAVPVAEVVIRAATRSNITIAEAGGVTTKFNEPGPHLATHEIDDLRARTAELGAQAEWVVTCGSLPGGCTNDLHSTLVSDGHAVGARIAVDTSGRALAEACLAGPDLLKPNLAELSELAGRALTRLGEVVEVAHRLRRRGVAAVLVSLGAEGAVLVEREAAWHAKSIPASVRSTVGAGDATLAGFLLGGGHGAEALRTAVAYGAAAVSLSGSRMPGPQDLNPAGVQVTGVDESLSLDGAAA